MKHPLDASEGTGDFERSLFASIEHSPIATVITNPRLPDNPIVAVNEAFCALTGYPAAEAIGWNCRFLSGPGTDRSAQAALRTAIAEGRPAITELLNYRKDGSAFRNAVMIAPIRAADGSVAYHLGSQMDVSGEADVPASLRRQRAADRVRTLTPRQRQVLEQMIQGLRNKQIAARLGIDEKTVKMHRASLLAKLGAATSADAIRLGVEAEI
jgi:PAS domain S-box-containing protein